MKAQEWLDKKYPQQIRKKIHSLTINNKDLEGELRVKDFVKLERIDCNENKLTNLCFSNCPKLAKVYCYGNELTNLEISNCPKISHLNVSCNLFDSFDFLNNLDPKKLTYLSVHTNNLPKSDLSVFEDFTNLEELYLDNYDEERFSRKIYNRFHGSLEPLKNLRKLRWLNVGGTDIESGLDYLPSSLKKLGCSSEMRGKCSTIEDELKKSTWIADVSEETTKVEEGDTKWTKDWYRFVQWCQVKDWEKKGFSSQEIREWVKVGVKLDELEFAVYLKEKKYILSTFKREVQTWVDWKYPKENREKVKELDISCKSLSGELNLTDFVNLEELDCYNNKITNLDLGNCSKLKELNCSDNQLTSVNFFDKQSEKLTLLNISGNNFFEKDLKFIESFAELQSLNLANNKFSGSLEPLKNMSNLQELDISDTNLNSGLEYIPSSLERFYCASEQKSDAEVKKIADKLLGYEENGEYNLQSWREDNVISRAQKWLDKGYPEDALCNRKSDKKNRGKKREEITELDISNQELKGKLKIEGFTKLKELNCSNNKLTDLDLSNCEKLEKLNCSNNQFTGTNFLINLRKPDKLIKLDIGKNNKISRQNLSFLTIFEKLVELNLETCPFEGSLESLKNMNKLKRICVSGTDIEGGLEYLSIGCEEFYCDRNLQGKSAKVVKELGKYLKNSDSEFGGTEYYDLAKWKEDKQNSIALIIPLERLYVIKSNMKKFHDKWGEKGENKEIKWWEIGEKSKTFWEKDGSDNLSRLQSPEEYGKYWYAVVPQWTSRAAAVAGGVLAINNNYNQIGGAIGIASTFFETVFSRIKEDLYDAKEKQWEDFIKDSESLLDNYDELIGILEPIHLGEGRVNEVIKELNSEVSSFLGVKEHNKGSNNRIDYSEWKKMLKEKTRKELTEELRKNWREENETSKKVILENIVEAIRKLEAEIIKYRQAFHYEIDEEVEVKEKEDKNEGLEDQGEEESKSFEQNQDNSFTQFLEDKNNLAISSTSQPTNVFRKRKISNAKESRPSQEIYELVDLQSKEELQTQIEVQPK